MTCCEGESAVSTSSPMALALMFSMSCLTTRKLTSASSSARRISRRALSMFSAESLPSPRRFLKTRCSFSDRLSNMSLCRGSDADTARRHLSGAVHAEFVQHPRAGAQVGGQAFDQARDVKEDVPASVIG